MRYLLILTLFSACQQAASSRPAPDMKSAAGASTDLGIPQATADLATSAADLLPPLNPVSLCPVDPMDQVYSGALPPNPYAPAPQASTCIAAFHDVIIVLGCPNNSDGTPSDCQTKRADIAVAFMQAGLGSRFITSGGAVHNAYVEADTLRQLLIDRGVAADQIWTDTHAQHTDENIYYSTLIMEKQGWTNALVISDDAGQLIMTTVCDSNCCVDLGRLTVLGFNLPSGTETEGHYVRYPWAQTVSTAECDQIESPLKAMCVNLSSRRACAGNLQLSPPDGG
jgi:hypothetical protein